MNTYSVFNDSKMYRSDIDEQQEVSIPSYPIFALKKNEEIHRTLVIYKRESIEQIQEKIDSTDRAIIEEIARSKYLTTNHIYKFVSLRGVNLSRRNLHKRMLKLMKYRLVKESEILLPGVVNGIKYYEVDINGYRIALSRGVIFNYGNRYLSFNKKMEMGIVDTPQDVKRILVGNQIIIGLLQSKAKMERFGVMETFRYDGINLDNCIIRTAANVKIDNTSVLAYEVVRDCSEAYQKLAEKVQRYYKILQSKKYLESNYHGDLTFPQLIICGESLEHNRKIVEYLKSQNLWNSEDVILFTEDLLNIKDTLQSIYEITGEEVIRWYRLPESKAG